MDNKKALTGLLALFLQIGVYFLLYTLFATFVYGEFTPTETSTMQFVWYAFLAIAIVSNIFDPLLYLQILIWGFVIKFTYNSEYAWLCLAALVIGLVAIMTNIVIRKRIPKTAATKNDSANK